MARPPWLESALGTLAARRLARELARRARATLHGAEHLPASGGALLVGNHALFGVDGVVLAALVHAETGRVASFLGEKNLFRVPVLRTLLDVGGVVPGAPDAAVRLLRAGELVGVYPGGVDDSFKLRAEAYRLMWGERAGFARVAVRAGVPIVPVAATGIDEVWEVRGRERRVGRALLGSSRYDLPLVRTLVPRSVPLEFHVLAPIDTAGDADDEAHVARVRARTHAALEGVLAPYRERLAGSPA